MALEGQEPQEPGKPRPPLQGFLGGLSFAFGVLALLGGTLAAVVKPECGDFPLLGRDVLEVFGVFAFGAIVVGHLFRRKLSYGCGYASVLLMFLVPAFKQPCFSPVQFTVVGSLREINAAEIIYSSKYANGFSPSLAALDGPPDLPPTADAAGLIDSILASGEKGGYHLIYSTSPRNKEGQITTYSITASPIRPGSGNYYYTDQTGVIRMNHTAPATATDAPLAG